MNKGQFVKGNYYKMVEFNRAVLWKTKELSVPRDVIEDFLKQKAELATFGDLKKNEKWIFKVSDILMFGKYRVIGQEEQFYFPISLAKKQKIKT